MSTTTIEPATETHKEVQHIPSATVRFAGDSGDGMQLAGEQFTNTSRPARQRRHHVPRLPRRDSRPAGTLAGVSGFQVHFSSTDIYTPGDTLDALVVMNPAALKTNLSDLRKGGILIVNADNFETKDCEKAGYDSQPAGRRSAGAHVPALQGADDQDRPRGAQGHWAWAPRRPTAARTSSRWAWSTGSTTATWSRRCAASTRSSPRSRRSSRPTLRALQGRLQLRRNDRGLRQHYQVAKAKLPPGKYKNITGNEALAWGLMTAAKLSGKELFLGSYPITPASDILHELSQVQELRRADVPGRGRDRRHLLGHRRRLRRRTWRSPPPAAPASPSRAKAIGLAVMTELPLLVINVQRGGPSTGLPTKTEQADLFQAMFGRNGECPVPVIAARSPADCFDMVQEAWRIATRFMTPVMLLSDGYIANGTEPWLIPDVSKLPQDQDQASRPDRQRRKVPALQARRAARPAVGHSRHAGAEAPHRRPGKAGRHRQRQLRAGQPPAHGQHAGQEGREHRPGHPAARGRRPGQRRAAGARAGAAPTARARPPSKPASKQGLSVAHCPPALPEPVPAEPGRRSSSSYKKVLVPELNIGQLRLLIRGQVPGRRPGPEQGPGQAVPRAGNRQRRSQEARPVDQRPAAEEPASPSPHCRRADDGG